MKPEETQREKKQTLYASHKGKRNSVTISGCSSVCGIVISVGIGIAVTVNCARPELGGGHEECVDRCRVVPVGACESNLFENLLMLDTILVKRVAEEMDVLRVSLTIVLGVLVGWDR
jgi:hypothetical protein